MARFTERAIEEAELPSLLAPPDPLSEKKGNTDMAQLKPSRLAQAKVSSSTQQVHQHQGDIDAEMFDSTGPSQGVATMQDRIVDIFIATYSSSNYPNTEYLNIWGLEDGT